MTAPYEHECSTCKDSGTLGRDPDGWERIYCEDCIKGLDLALAHWSRLINTYTEVLVRWEANAPDSKFTKITRAALKEAIQEHDRLEQARDSLALDAKEREPEIPFFEDGS